VVTLGRPLVTALLEASGPTVRGAWPTLLNTKLVSSGLRLDVAPLFLGLSLLDLGFVEVEEREVFKIAGRSGVAFPSDLLVYISI